MRNPTRTKAIWMWMGGLLLLVTTGTTPVQAQDPPVLDGSAEDMQVMLSWTVPGGLDSDETVVGYRVYRDVQSIPDVTPSDVAALQIAEITEPTDAPATEYVDADVSNETTYFYRVTALVLEQGDSQADETNFSNQTSVTPSVPPEIVVETPAVPASDAVSAGNDVPVRVEASDPQGVAAVRLRYRRGGTQAFTTQAMQANGNDYDATIPGAVVDAAGVEFVVEAEDTGGSVRRLPDAGVYSVRVEVQSLTLTQRGGATASAFRMVTLPTTLNDDRVSDVFVDALGTFDDTAWRLFAVADGALDDPSDYVEVRDGSATFAPGDAAWLISRDDATVPLGQGVTVRTDRPFEVALNAGWNLVGHPFAFPVPLDRLTVIGGSLGDVFAFDGQFVPLSGGDVLNPFEGVLVRLVGGASGTLRVDPSADAPSVAASQGKRAAPMDWQLGVAVTSASGRDTYNVVGVSAGARASVDAMDGHEPPAAGPVLSLAFLPDGTGGPRLWRDVRRSTERVQTWTLDVRGGEPGLVTLSVSGLAALPDGWTAVLVDPVHDVAHDLSRDGSYRFGASGSGDARTLELVVGSRDALSDVVDGGDGVDRATLHPPVPHPVRTHATLRYTLPAPAPVRLEVFDLLGRRVTTLVDAPADRAGTHTRTWDLRGVGGRLSSGTYFVRLTAGDVVDTRRLIVVR